MTESPDDQTLSLSRKELISLYLILTGQEDSLDDTQHDVLRRVCELVYAQLSVDQVERIESYYESL